MTDIMRTLVTLEDRQVEKLDAIARRRKTSRAALVREAVGRYVEHETASEQAAKMQGAFGLWDDLGQPVDGLVYQLAIRSEWNHRP